MTTPGLASRAGGRQFAGVVQFRLFGIPVTVQPWFWLIMALFGYWIAGSGLNNPQAQLVGVGLFVFVGFLSILVHELGHALVGRWLGGGEPHIVLHSFGGYAAFPLGTLSRWHHMAMVAAGPGFQLALAGLAFVVLLVLPATTPQLLRFSVGMLLWVSVLWPLINLVPVLPLDGGQILADLLGAGRRALAHKISAGVAVVLIPFTIGVFLLAPIWLGFLAWTNWQQAREADSRWR